MTWSKHMGNLSPRKPHPLSTARYTQRRKWRRHYLAVNFTTKSHSHVDMWAAGCCDTGAPVTVGGNRTIRQLCQALGIPIELHASQLRFRFADSRYPSLGRVRLFLPTPPGLRYFYVEVVRVDIPLLLVLDMKDDVAVTLNTLTNTLDSLDGWSLPLTRHRGHIYLTWPSVEILFTRAELPKFHRQFFTLPLSSYTNCSVERNRRIFPLLLCKSWRTFLQNANHAKDTRDARCASQLDLLSQTTSYLTDKLLST